MEETDYEKQAREVLAKIGATIAIKLSDTKKAPWQTDQNPVHHYRVTLKNSDGKSYHFDFWDSVVAYQKGERPSEYDVLSCLEYNAADSFKEFCFEFGYDTDSIRAHKTWKACLDQTRALRRLFSQDQISLLQEIR